MTDRRMRAFNKLLGRVTGISIHNSKNTLAALTDADMPAFSVYTENLLVDKKPQLRRCFRVHTTCEVIAKQLKSLFNAGAFCRLSSFSLLQEDTILIRFIGDKGGTFMQFKFGLTVMSCMEPNSTPFFNLLASMDAFDTHHNLEKAIFLAWA